MSGWLIRFSLVGSAVGGLMTQHLYCGFAHIHAGTLALASEILSHAAYLSCTPSFRLCSYATVPRLSASM